MQYHPLSLRVRRGFCAHAHHHATLPVPCLHSFKPVTAGRSWTGLAALATRSPLVSASLTTSLTFHWERLATAAAALQAVQPSRSCTLPLSRSTVGQPGQATRPCRLMGSAAIAAVRTVAAVWLAVSSRGSRAGRCRCPGLPAWATCRHRTCRVPLAALLTVSSSSSRSRVCLQCQQPAQMAVSSSSGRCRKRVGSRGKTVRRTGSNCGCCCSAQHVCGALSR